jgi:hypothetical protein
MLGSSWASGGLYDSATFDAARANFDSLDLTIDLGTNFLKVWQPTPPG